MSKTKLRKQPIKNLLIYYGWPNSFNSGINGWDNEKVAQDLANYNLIVIGNGLQDPAHQDHSNTITIVARIAALKPAVTIFGYIDLVQSTEDFNAKVDQWVAVGVGGIFIDQAGYDFGTAATNGREAFNKKVDYIHASNLVVMVNSWNPAHVLDTSDDPNTSNSTYNPKRLESVLNEDDWYLMENFGVSQGNYESKTQWLDRGQKIKAIQRNKDINIAAISEIANSDNSGQAKFEFSQIAAAIFSFDAYGSSDMNYGASTSVVDRHTKKGLSGLGDDLIADAPNVQNSGNKYFRYTSHGKLTLDFTSGSEASSVDKN